MKKKKENLAQTNDCDITYDMGFIKKLKLQYETEHFLNP